METSARVGLGCATRWLTRDARCSGRRKAPARAGLQDAAAGERPEKAEAGS